MEAYCIKCRRMVRAHQAAKTGVWILEEHFRFDLSRVGHPVPCRGMITSSKITFGEEDPKAAFRDGGRKAWGFVGRDVDQGMRYDYVD